MSGHHHTTEITCPNCGNNTTGNYCSQCGQETHLHKDTLWALTVHFIGHYFHYDSKFWQTLKTLVASPGKLTLAYWNKQRNRYLSPISLYLFVSFIFFFVVFSQSGTTVYERDENGKIKTDKVHNPDSVAVVTVNKYLAGDKPLKMKTPEQQQERLEKRKKLADGFLHQVPKLLFFMIPLMAIVLNLLFLRRKELTIVHHTIFSLHIQSAYFLSYTLTINGLTGIVADIIGIIFSVAPMIYTSLALKNVYSTRWPKAILYNIIIIVSYAVFIFVVSAIYFALVYLKDTYFPGTHSGH